MICTIHTAPFGKSEVICRSVIIFLFFLLLLFKFIISEAPCQAVVNMITDRSKKGWDPQSGKIFRSMVINKATSDPGWGWNTGSRAWFKVLADLASLSASIFLFFCNMLGRERFFRSCMIAGEVWVWDTRLRGVGDVCHCISHCTRCENLAKSFEKS